MAQTSPYIIRTSDRQTFKRCRTKWDFGSKIRQNYEPLGRIKALDFGTAVHKGLEVFYNPITWEDRLLKESLARVAFVEIIEEQKQKQVAVGSMVVDFELDFQQRLELGLGMLEQYFKYSAIHDVDYVPIGVEVEFEVPIKVPQGYRTMWDSKYPDFNFDGPDEVLTLKGLPVVVQGRIDLILQHRVTGKYKIVDHKTAAQLADPSWLNLDEQGSTYAWALFEMLGLDIDGFIYNEIRKSAPHKPKVLKSGELSKDKNQNTSLDIYLETIEEMGLNKDDYTEFLAFLEIFPKQWVRRTVIRHNSHQHKMQGIRLFQEAVEMLANPIIYPNPNRMNCNGCQFYAVCSATNDGGDVRSLLAEMYQKRASGEMEVEDDNEEE